MTRYKQQLDVVQTELFQSLLLADYTFPKNRVFAYMNLSDDELMLFDKLYAMLEPQVPTPDLVLYLAADTETCMGRIKKRQRSYEKEMSEDYIAQLIDAYNTTTTTTPRPHCSSSTPDTSISSSERKTSKSWCTS